MHLRATVFTVFVDANVVVKGIVARWGAAKAVLTLGAQSLIRAITSEVVTIEVERALEHRGIPTGAGSEYADLMHRLRLDVLPRPSSTDVAAAMPDLLPLVRHRADVAVIVAAIAAQPDWLVSENERHFNAAVARCTGLRIATPQRFLEALVGRPESE